jgi:hypothetical protein
MTRKLYKPIVMMILCMYDTGDSVYGESWRQGKVSRETGYGFFSCGRCLAVQASIIPGVLHSGNQLYSLFHEYFTVEYVQPLLMTCPFDTEIFGNTCQVLYVKA